MKKSMLTIMSAVLSFSLMAGSALAAPKEDKGERGNAPESKPAVTETKKETDVTVKTEGSATVTSVTYDTYGNGYKGLERAYQNVKDKPAGAVIANLLSSKYGIDVTASAALSEKADELEATGEVEVAADVQKEAIKLDPANLDLYKKLGKFLDKLGKKGVKAFVNGEEPNFEVAPFIKDGSTLVPFRAIAESLKAEVSWDEETRTVTVVKNGITVKLEIGNTTATVDGKEVTLEVPGEIYDGSTMVPVRFISESLKAKVDWEAESQTVVVTE